MQPVNSQQLNRCIDILNLGLILRYKIDTSLQTPLKEICSTHTEIDSASAMAKVNELTKWWDVNIPSSEGLNFSDYKLKYITKNELTLKGYPDIPSEVCKLSNLVLFIISGNKIKEVPPGIDNLTKLKTIDLSLNCIKSLPSSFVKLSNLKELSLSSQTAGLKNIPNEIFELTNLEVLDVSGNRLQNIPNEICKLVNLKKLNISNNSLLSEISILSFLKINELNVAKNNNRWDSDFLQRRRRDELTILGADVELSKNIFKVELSVFSFDQLLQLFNAPNSLDEHQTKYLFEAITIYFQQKLTILSNYYEESQTLKSNHNFQLFIIQLLSSENPKIVNSLFTALFSLSYIDNDFLDFIPKQDLFLKFISIFNRFSFHKDIIDNVLTCFCCSFDDKNKFSFTQHPLLLIRKNNINKTSIYDIMSILNMTQTSPADLKKIKELIKNLIEFLKNNPTSQRLYFFKNLKEIERFNLKLPEDSREELTFTDKLICKQTDLCKLDILELCENVSSATYDEELHPIAWKNFIESLLEMTHKNSISFFDIPPLFDFIYRRCYDNTRLLAELALTDSRILPFLFTHLNHPGYEKKSLEAIALLMHANPKLRIPKESINIVRNSKYINYVLSGEPKQGAKLAWSGALEIVNRLPDFLLSIALKDIVLKDIFLHSHQAKFEERRDQKFNRLKARLRKEISNELITNEQTAETYKRSIIANRENKISEIENECFKIRSIFSETSNIRLPFLPFSREKTTTIILNRSTGEFFINERLRQINEILKDFLDTDIANEKIKDYEIQYRKIKNLWKDQTIPEFENTVLENTILVDTIIENLKQEYRSKSIELYNANYILPTQELNSEIISKINRCNSILTQFCADLQSEDCLLSPEQFQYCLKTGTSLDKRFAERSSSKYMKFQSILAEFTKEQLKLNESTQLQYFNQKNEELKREIKELKNENSLLNSKLARMEKKFETIAISETRSSDDESNVRQTAQQIQEAIANLREFKIIPKKSNWTEEQTRGWESIIKNLDKIEELTEPHPKQLRNWKRKEAIDFLRLAGYEAKKNQLDGSHLEVRHPLFNKLNESTSINTKKETAIRLMKIYFENVLKILDLWYVEVTKKRGVPFGQ